MKIWILIDSINTPISTQTCSPLPKDFFSYSLNLFNSPPLIFLFFYHYHYLISLSYLPSTSISFFLFFFLFFFSFPLSTAPRSLHFKQQFLPISILSFFLLSFLFEFLLTILDCVHLIPNLWKFIYTYNNVGNVVWRYGLLIKNCKQFLEFGLNI